jgi:predicted Zn-dependent protease
MNQRYDYDMFPRTWRARAILALAFVPGLALLALFVLIPGPHENVEPQSACAPQGNLDCLQAQQALARDSTTCMGSGYHVCLAPLGQVSPKLVRHLVDHYADEYHLRVAVLTPIAIPEDLLNAERGQVDALELAELMRYRYPQETAGPGPVIIGLTSVDMYISTSHWRYAFGIREPEAVISTARMDPAAYGLPPDDDLTFSRARKLVSKYIGLLHFHLQPSDNPKSPMFNNILSPADLDLMSEPLPR